MPGTDTHARAATLAPRATVAILTALPIEQVAMQVMLDDAVPYSTPGNAPGEYCLGTVPSKEGGEHVVVLGQSMVGENLAAANTTILLERFPHIEQVIMVGIAGAAPDSRTQEADVRLGDIVVCSGEGVVQYDFEKEVLKDGVLSSEARTPPRPASSRLTIANSELHTGAFLNRRPWEQHFARADAYSWGKRPNNPDILHNHERPSQQVDRLPDTGGRIAGMPRVFTGKIASANKLLKNAKLREQLRVRFGVKAVEMEASGIADASWLQRVGYFVVRGTCDYCDEHKNDAWQEYAAMIAAAYTRALLEVTRSASPRDIASSKPVENADPISGIPQVLKDSVISSAASMGESSGKFVSALGDLIKAEEESQNDQFDAAWPSDRPWSQSVLEALATTLSSYGISLKPAEMLLMVALPYLSSCIHKAWIEATFGAGRDEANRQLLAASHAVEPLLDKDLPEPSTRLVVRWAMLRMMSEQRSSWSDALIQKLSPTVPLARSLAADATLPTLLRVIAGNVTQFDSLPPFGLLRLFDHTLEVRWKLIACVITLAELRVVGTHLLSAEIIEHVAQLPDVQEAVDRQFGKISVEIDADQSWVIRAICDEPVLDYAITEIARQLDTELRTRRRKLSDHLLVTSGRGFPTVRSEPQASLVDGRPRYTTPHVTFAMAPEHTRRLFMGSDLWGDPSYAFRELFQNALDACRYRVARSQFIGTSYMPRIRLFHGKAADGREFVECEDNGIGMDREIVASCFAMAGRRFVNTEEFRREHDRWREQRIKVHTNSQFGIGVFSYFLAADELEVETARLGRACESPTGRLLLRVPTAAALFRIVELSDEEARSMQRARAEERKDTPSGHLDAGSRVRLWLRRGTETRQEGFKARVSCVDAIREHVWFSDVAVDVRDYRGQQYQIEANGLAPWLSQTVEAKGLNSRFWWIVGDLSDRPDSSQRQEAIATFRSQKRGKDGGPGRYSNPGRILVDGISTDLTTPGFILNLAGEQTPKLSLDRRTIHTNLHLQVEQLIEQALPFLPTDVAQSFLQDLWHWDPRACHKATRIISERQSGWLRDRSYLTGIGYAPPERARESFMPEVATDLGSFADTMDFRKRLLSIAELARRSPEARSWSAIELEARGVPSQLRDHLRNIPDRIWQAWQRFDLGVPEACALLYGSSGRNSVALPVYVSWLTGETAEACSKRLVRLRELLDLQWKPSADVPDVVLSDYDAWLLGRGQVSTSWIGPTITTRDVLLFCSNAGTPLASALEEYSEISVRLGIDMHVDMHLAEKVGSLAHGEAVQLVMMGLGLGDGWREIGNVAPERETLLAVAAGVAGFKSETRPRRSPANETERVLIGEIRRLAQRGRPLTLAALCEIARTFKRAVSDVARDVGAIAEDLGVECAWDAGGVEATSQFTAADWAVAEDATDGFLSRRKSIVPRTSIRLAALLAIGSYVFPSDERASEKILRRAERVYSILGWGTVPLNDADAAYAQSLDYQDGALLNDAPPDGVLSIPRLLAKAATSDSTLVQLDASCTKLARFGIRGPSPNDTYLGVRWSEALLEPKSESEGG